MAVFGVYIRKNDRFAGQERNFGNTYHYETDPGQLFPDQAIAEELSRLEKTVTQSQVQFNFWSTWGPTDGPSSANIMRQEGTLTGQGSAQTSPGTYKEIAALVAIELPRSSTTNRRRWLRKFIRVPGRQGAIVADAQLSGEEPIPQDMIDILVAYGNNIKNLDIATTSYPLVTEQGVRVPLATPAEARPFLITRQIGN